VFPCTPSISAPVAVELRRYTSLPILPGLPAGAARFERHTTCLCKSFFLAKMGLGALDWSRGGLLMATKLSGQVV